MPPCNLRGMVPPPYGSRGMVQPPYGGRGMVQPPVPIGRGMVPPPYGVRGMVQPPYGVRGMVQPPIGRGMEQPPNGRGMVRPPYGGRGMVQPPIGRGMVQPPIGRGIVQPPYGGRGMVQPPIGRGMVQPPIGRGIVQPPFGGRGMVPPYGCRSMVPAPPQPVNNMSCGLPSKSIKVSIHGNLTKDDLEMIFGQFGTITTQSSIIRGNPDFAYINYYASDEAQVAALSMNGKQIKGVRVGVKLRMDGKESGTPMASVSSHDFRHIQCESLIVRVIMSPHLSAEYKLQLQGIESSTSTKVTLMKTGNGFNILGNQESLDEAKKHLELVISKVREKLEEESFTLSCHYVPLFTNHEQLLTKQISEIEQKHYIEFLVDINAQQPVDLSTFSRFVSTQLKGHTDTPATIDCISKFLSASTEPQSPEGEDIWEWQDDDGSFKAYEPDQSKDFSLRFRQDPTCTFTCLIATKVGVSGYSINLSTMIQTNIKTGNKRRIQRQPVSSTCTSGVWFYTDDKRKLVPYTKQQSREIEKVWTAGSRTLTLTINGKIYKLDLTQMKQTNVLTHHERKIARISKSDRQLNFRVHGLKQNLKQAVLDLKEKLQDGVIKSSISLPSDSEGAFHSSLCELTKHYFVSALVCNNNIHIIGVQGYIDKVAIIVQEEILLFQTKLLAQRPITASTSHSISQPDHWDIQEDKIALKSVVRGSKEWTEVEKLMHTSLPSAQILTLQRIQNQWLWDKYSFSKERMHEQNNGIINEKQLFHGTSSTPPEKIFKSRQGFDFRFCSRGMWGTGTYFAVNASYSDNYAYRSSGAKQLILAKVLTGETYRSVPDSSLKKPPVKKSHVHSSTSSDTFVDELYDSVCGHTKGSDIFVIYDHEKAYSDYLITYDTDCSSIY